MSSTIRPRTTAPAQREIAYFDEVGLDLIKISVKASNVPLMVNDSRPARFLEDPTSFAFGA